MKKDKSCKTRKGESTIGKIIYGFLLFAPLFAILTACLTNIFTESENAINVIKHKYQTNEITSNNSFIEGNAYTFIDNWVITPVEENLKIFDITLLTDLNTQWNSGTLQQEDQHYTLYIMTTGNLRIYRTIGSSIQYTQINNRQFDFVINEIFNIENLDENFYTYFEKYNSEIILTTGEITANKEKVFYRAVNDVEESNIFNWSKNTAIYQGVQATTNTLGITNTFIPMLLAYWLIISILYFIYDIVLMIILILHDKIHELQESI